MSVDKGHVLRFRVSKLPCDPLLIPNEGLTLISFKHRYIFEEDSKYFFFKKYLSRPHTSNAKYCKYYSRYSML